MFEMDVYNVDNKAINKKIDARMIIIIICFVLFCVLELL